MTDTKDVALRHANDAALHRAEDFGGMAVAPKYVNIKIGHGKINTAKGEKLGHFNFQDGLFPPVEKMVHCVMLLPFKNRSLFDKGFDPNKPPICKSDDGEEPSDSIKTPMSEFCNSCFAQEWDNRLSNEDLERKRALEARLDEKKSIKPICNNQLNLVIADKNLVPMLLVGRKGQVGIIQKNLINKLLYSGKRPFMVAFDMGLVAAPNGNSFNLTFDNFRDADNPEAYHKLKLICSNAQKDVARAHEELSVEREVGGFMVDEPRDEEEMF